MAAKNRGQLIKEARTAAGYTQEQLAKKVKGLTASDISKVERNQLDITNEQIKAIAKATGVTQKSLLEAPVPKKASSKPSSSKPSSGKKPASSSSGTTIKVTAAEKKLLQLYRAADEDSKKAALAILKKDKKDEVGGILGSLINNPDIKDALSGLQSLL